MLKSMLTGKSNTADDEAGDEEEEEEEDAAGVSASGKLSHKELFFELQDFNSVVFLAFTDNIEGLLESLSVHYLGGAIHWAPRARLYLERSAELGSDTPGNIKVGEFVLEVTVAKQKLTN